MAPLPAAGFTLFPPPTAIWAAASLAHALAAVAAGSARSAGGTGRKAFTWAHGAMIGTRCGGADSICVLRVAF